MTKTNGNGKAEETDAQFPRKYRPRTWKEIVGQKEAVTILRNKVKKPPTTLLLIGHSAVGKTSAAQVFAREVTGEFYDQDVIEENAASAKGIDRIRALVDFIHVKPYGKKKVIILDECDKLTSDAKSALLKPLEDPPPYVVWILVTSRPEALPIDITSRALSVSFFKVTVKDLVRLLDRVIKIEQLDVSRKAREEIALASHGSPRRALILLEKIADIPRKNQRRYIRHRAGNPVSRTKVSPQELAAKLLLSILNKKPGVYAASVFLFESNYALSDIMPFLKQYCRSLMMYAPYLANATKENRAFLDGKLTDDEKEILKSAKTTDPELLMAFFTKLQSLSHGEMRWEDSLVQLVGCWTSKP